MDWTRESLFAKAKLYAHKAHEEERNSCWFFLALSLSLEFLAKAALAHVSSVLLLADTKRIENVCYALGKGKSPQGPPQMVGSRLALQRCAHAIEGFSEEENRLGEGILDQRNLELHTAISAFESIKSNEWLTNFYRVARPLLHSQGLEFKDLVGPDEALIATHLVDAAEEQLKQRVTGLIEKARRTLDALSEREKQEALNAEPTLRSILPTTRASNIGFKLVTCPVCSASGVLMGKKLSRSVTKIERDYVSVTYHLSPNEFVCKVCGLKLSTHAEVIAAGFDAYFTIPTRAKPVDFFDHEELEDTILGSLSDEELLELRPDLIETVLNMLSRERDHWGGL